MNVVFIHATLEWRKYSSTNYPATFGRGTPIWRETMRCLRGGGEWRVRRRRQCGRELAYTPRRADTPVLVELRANLYSASRAHDSRGTR